MAYVIAEPCIDVKDRACVDECPVDCIYEGPRMLYIQPEECVDCDACVPVCPVTAIFAEDDLPNEWKPFAVVNAEYFAEGVTGLGSPGGAAQVGPSAVDHATVAAWAADQLSRETVAARSHPGKGSIVDIPEIRFTTTVDGVHIAYQALGAGPVDPRVPAPPSARRGP